MESLFCQIIAKQMNVLNTGTNYFVVYFYTKWEETSWVDRKETCYLLYKQVKLQLVGIPTVFHYSNSCETSVS